MYPGKRPLIKLPSLFVYFILVFLLFQFFKLLVIISLYRPFVSEGQISQVNICL